MVTGILNVGDGVPVQRCNRCGNNATTSVRLRYAPTRALPVRGRKKNAHLRTPSATCGTPLAIECALELKNFE